MPIATPHQDEFRLSTRRRLINLGLHSYGPTLHANFKEYGAEFDVESFGDFVLLAQDHLRLALDEESAEAYTLFETASGGVALDYKFMVRAVYNRQGKPISFYKPRFLSSGYANPQQELRDFMEAVKFKDY